MQRSEKLLTVKSSSGGAQKRAAQYRMVKSSAVGGDEELSGISAMKDPQKICMLQGRPSQIRSTTPKRVCTGLVKGSVLMGFNNAKKPQRRASLQRYNEGLLQGVRLMDGESQEELPT